MLGTGQGTMLGTEMGPRNHARYWPRNHVRWARPDPPREMAFFFGGGGQWHLPAYYKILKVSGVRSIFSTSFGRRQQRCGHSLPVQQPLILIFRNLIGIVIGGSLKFVHPVCFPSSLESTPGFSPSTTHKSVQF